MHTNTVDELNIQSVTGSSFEIKTEADSSDITERPHDDKTKLKTKLYLFTVSQMIYMGSEFEYNWKDTLEKSVFM